jgi:hypothetical protein
MMTFVVDILSRAEGTFQMENKKMGDDNNRSLTLLLLVVVIGYTGSRCLLRAAKIRSFSPSPPFPVCVWLWYCTLLRYSVMLIFA